MTTRCTFHTIAAQHGWALARGPRCRRARVKGATVDFDIFSEQQMAKPWPAGHEKKVFNDTIEQAKLCDGLG